MIYKLEQNRVSRTYKGGHNIEAFTNERLDITSDFFPEDWTGSAICANQEGYGKTTDGLLVKDIVGDDTFPVLLKLLDSDERLVIQAHPSVEFSKKHLNSPFGKTECWYFLDCSPDACVYLGFKPTVTKEIWQNAIEKQDVDTLLSCLHKVPVKKGDFIFVDGGLPHAIGAGCFMIELQEPTDFMVVAEKVTPSGNKIPDYRLTMGLSMDLALNVYNYTTYTKEELYSRFIKEITFETNSIVPILGKSQTDKFKMNLLCGNCTYEQEKAYAIAVVLNGEGAINGHNVKKGNRLFLVNETAIKTSGDTLEIVICE